MKTIRCVIYTRKSSDEGLEQGFNSLDAQREACAAYILSQASEGWVALPDVYDDGGISGGTLDRPALQRLMGEVAAGRIDTIVVYKVDRLTRSLLDFSKLVEAFDKAGTSFVSITQSFNTTTSMGRLTLNMLLSFAQFEREVTAERIRDKIAASKAKGMWMGGIPPLGYKPDGRSLAIVEEHAALVRGVFERYLARGNVRRVAEDLVRDDIITPMRIKAKTGQTFGGVPLSRGQIYCILKCPTYVGEVHHNGQVYAGLHQAIIDREVWDQVQERLAENLQGRRSGVYARSASLLAGKVEDASGMPLGCDHAAKPGLEGGKIRYRYYTSRSDAPAVLRVPARELEALVVEQVAALLADPPALAAATPIALTPEQLRQLQANAGQLGTLARDRPFMDQFVIKVRILLDAVAIDCALEPLARLVGIETPADTAVTLTCPSRLTRTGRALKLVQPGGALIGDATPNLALIRLLLQARAWHAELRNGATDIGTLARSLGKTSSYVTRVVRLAFLAPNVVAALLAGRLRAGIGAQALVQPNAIPACWQEQRRRFLPDRASTETPVAANRGSMAGDQPKAGSSARI